ncbi:hypothetical protein D3C86_2068290 [compost metagenome]
MPVYVLTRLGQQIVGLGTFTPDDEYLRVVGKAIANQGFDVFLGDWSDLPGDGRRGYFSNGQEIHRDPPSTVE